MLCFAFALASCRNEASITPSVSDAFVQENLRSEELTEIKEHFDDNKNIASLDQNSPERNFEPRWNKSSVQDDRIEFDIFENGKLPMTKLTSSGLKLGRFKFVYLRNNPDDAKRALIANFTPSEDFDGDISKVNTKNYRRLQFDGLIAFYELNGTVSEAYKVVNGVVTNQLKFLRKDEIRPRCGEVYITTTYYYTMGHSPAYPQNGCTISYAGSGQSYSYGVPCISSGGGGYGGSNGSSSASGLGNSSTYNAYLATVPVIRSLCPQSIAGGLVEPSSNYGFSTGSSNSCLPNQRVNFKGEYFQGFSVSNATGNPGLSADFLYISLFKVVGETNDISGVSQRISSAYSAAMSEYQTNGRQGNIDDFLKNWAGKFNQMLTNKGKYCVQLERTQELKKGDLARAVPLKDRSDSTCP